MFFFNMCKISIFLKQSEYSIMLNSLWSIDFKLEKIMILNLTQSLRIIIFFGLSIYDNNVFGLMYLDHIVKSETAKSVVNVLGRR